MTIRALLPLAGMLLAACALLPEGGAPPERKGAGQVDDARLLAAAGENDAWLSYGRTYDEQRFSPLRQIDENNVGELGLVWAFEPGTRRLEPGLRLHGRRRLPP